MARRDGGSKRGSARSERPLAKGGRPPNRSEGGDGARAGTARPGPDIKGLDLLYGVHAATAALGNKARRIRHIWASPNAAKRLDLPASLRPLVEIVPPGELDARVPDGAVHQGLVVLSEPLAEPDIADVAAMTRVAVLDQITDPHNVGAILRSAAAFGVEAIIVTERHAPTMTGLIAKIASGGLERVPLIRATNLARALQTIQGQGFFCVGLAGETTTDLADAMDGTQRLALVLGGEGPGLRRLTRERCDVLARIPMPGAMESLNVSNAAAIAFYLASRRRAD